MPPGGEWNRTTVGKMADCSMNVNFPNTITIPIFIVKFKISFMNLPLRVTSILLKKIFF